jgi:RNA polymerase sigma-70 factor (ECF subfamily)
VLLKGEAEAAQEDAPGPGEDVEEQERSRRVREALAALGEKDREALLLWDAGLSYPEIARQTGLAVGSVGTTLARARRRLAEAYREKEQTDAARG